MEKVFSKETLETRIEGLQIKMEKAGIDAALIKQNADLFYFAGTMQDCYLFVPQNGTPVLMIRRNLARARAESSLECTIKIESVRQIPGILREQAHGNNKVLGLEYDVIPAKLYFHLRGLFPETKTTDISPLIREVRSIKSALEIEWMRKAAVQLNSVIEEVPHFLRPGMTELELAAELEYRLRRAGHQGFMRMRGWNQELFFGHILSGPAGAVPSYFLGATGGIGTVAFGQSASKKVLSVGEPVSIDLGGCVNGYMVDQTRMFSLGDLPRDLLKAYDTVKEIHYALREIIKVGKTCGSIYEWACDRASACGYADNFLGFGESKVEFLGHGIGLEVDELPVLSADNPMVLEAGMTFAVEPKLIFPGVGHIGIEDTYLLSEKGVEPLTISRDELISIR